MSENTKEQAAKLAKELGLSLEVLDVDGKAMLGFDRYDANGKRWELSLPCPSNADHWQRDWDYVETSVRNAFSAVS